MQPCHETDLIEDLFEEFDIPCEGPQIDPTAFAHPDTVPATWVMYKTCGHHRLLCDDCVEGYHNKIARRDHFTCATCGTEGQTIARFERLNKS